VNREVWISSGQNKRIRAVARLRNRSVREAQGKFLIDGWREVERAVAAGISVPTLFVGGGVPLTPSQRQWLSELEVRNSTEIIHLEKDPYERIAFGQHTSGPVAVAVTPPHGLERIEVPPNPLIAVLEGIEKPGNLGAILRTADGAGVDAVIAVQEGTDLYNPNVIRASLGTVFTVPVCSASVPETVDWLSSRVERMIVTRVDAQLTYDQADYRPGCAMVLGSEAAGVSGVWRSGEFTPVRIPMLGVADSLNVSVAAAVLFYEARRQRT
jgi:TrmH family RNA methyltransferase